MRAILIALLSFFLLCPQQKPILTQPINSRGLTMTNENAGGILHQVSGEIILSQMG